MTPWGLDLFDSLSHTHTQAQNTATINTAADNQCCLVCVYMHLSTNTNKQTTTALITTQCQHGRSHLVMGLLIPPQRSFWPLWPAPQSFIPAQFSLSQARRSNKHQLYGPGQILSLRVNISESFLVSKSRQTETDWSASSYHCAPQSHVSFREWPWCSQTTF